VCVGEGGGGSISGYGYQQLFIFTRSFLPLSLDLVASSNNPCTIYLGIVKGRANEAGNGGNVSSQTIW
jgi:hypothetical protein